MARHSTNLAANLDIEMLHARGVAISDANVPDDDLPVCADLADQLCGRFLLRYVRKAALAAYTFAAPGTAWPDTAYVTPTALCRRETKGALNLPPTLPAPTHAVLLDPANLHATGPRRVRWAPTVEYILPNGFTVDDVVWPLWPVALA